MEFCVVWLVSNLKHLLVAYFIYLFQFILHSHQQIQLTCQLHSVKRGQEAL